MCETMLCFLLLSPLVTVVCGWPGGAFERALCASGACYTLHTDSRVTFDRARANCVDNGGDLMTVADRQEERVLESLPPLAGRRPGREKTTALWIGLKLGRGQCVLPESALRGFQWLSSSSSTTSTTDDGRYSNWAAGHPISTCTEERCAQVRYFTSGVQNNHLKWLDGHCRKPAFYACKFYFKGMCRPLALPEAGRVNYTAPFSSKPLRNDMRSLPMGTYAEVSCGGGGDHRDHDDPVHFSVCRAAADGSYGWSSAGPFCASGQKNCAFNNGGCEHLCLEEEEPADGGGGGGGACACKDGYELSRADRASCSPTDPCHRAGCQHRCTAADSGFTCSCPDGFTLSSDLRNCSDVDECLRTAPQVCAGHACVNTEGGYACVCRHGYEAVVDGDGQRCRDVDECAEAELNRCDQKCLNSLGSFSCHCDAGFLASGDGGRSCVDVDECLSSSGSASSSSERRCEFACTNTVGGFTCAPCPEGARLDDDGVSCVSFGRHRTEEEVERQQDATTPPSDVQEVPRHRTTTAEPAAATAVPTTAVPNDRNQNRTFPTDVPAVVLHAATSTSVAPNNNVSLFGRNVLVVSRPFSSRTLVCVLGSVVPLLLAVMVTVAIVAFKVSRSKREAARKTVLTDGYCWVASGFEPHLERLYESVLTDDDPPASTLESEA